jgi:hypothetical protein
MAKYEIEIINLSPIKQEAVNRLDKLKEQIMKCYNGYEDIMYKKSFNDMLDAVGEAKQCLISGFDKDGKAVK